MASTDRSLKKDKNQNIQVFVRLRPLNQRERQIRSIGVVDVLNHREVVVKQSQQTSHTKRFTFDRAFGPNVEQVEVYKDVVSPLIAEVLAGYNCTVFAYGQTGTGKTHTMVGESTGEGTTWQNDPLAGIIPRALSQLFDELRISNSEYTVRVSYLELYNEELFDLLSSSDDNSKLRIYEDVTRKGSTIVNGLEEVTVYNKNEVYQIMAQGQERKKVASTLMNAQSSRSHTVFTIVVHMKENCPKGEELVKIGKLNLVDLAGSENISKAGSDNPAKKERARECVNINQSLLTLGRVITALVEKHPHIPYRESKLTRILQESLGGRTKTSIIATISPGHKDLEETMSTLEYAHRAKNIQNKPEINQKLTKQAILKDFAEEVDKLKRELTAAREKNGVFLPKETYEEMTLKQDDYRREISELLLKKRAMEEERERLLCVFSELEASAARTQSDLAHAQRELEETTARLAETSQARLEQEHLVSQHVSTESRLSVQARELLRAAERAAGDVAELHGAVHRRRSVESSNREVVGTFLEQSGAQRGGILGEVERLSAGFEVVRDQLQAAIDDHTRDTSMAHEMTIQDMKMLSNRMAQFITEIQTLTAESENQLNAANAQCQSTLEQSTSTRRAMLQAVLDTLVTTVAACVDKAAGTDVIGTVDRSTGQWLTGATERVSCLQRVHNNYSAQAKALECKREESARRHHRGRVSQLKSREENANACIQQLEKDKQATRQRMAEQLSLIESERDSTERRLQDWAEYERRSLEERVARHVEIERNALNAKIERHMAELQRLQDVYEESAEKCLVLQEKVLELNKQEADLETKYLEMCAEESKRCVTSTDVFAKEFGEGTSGITAEMEAYSQSVVQIVAHTNDQLMAELRDTKDTVEKSSVEVATADATSTQQFTQSALAATSHVVHTANDAIRTVLHNTEESASHTMATLSSVCDRTATLEASSLGRQSAQTGRLAGAAGALRAACGAVRERLDQYAELEARCLLTNFRAYAPTGNTPARREYRYPRRLVATSPHDRILARFRHQAHNGHQALDSPLGFVHLARDAHGNSPDSDCIVLESDERHTSDSDEVSESSVSGDSAVVMQ